MAARVIVLAEHHNERQTAAWNRYLAARETAERTGSVGDGIAAGKAWRAWLTLFQSPEQTAAAVAFDEALRRRRR